MIKLEQKILRQINNDQYRKQLIIKSQNSAAFFILNDTKSYKYPNIHKRWGFFERRKTKLTIGVGCGIGSVFAKFEMNKLLEKIDDDNIFKEIIIKQYDNNRTS